MQARMAALADPEGRRLDDVIAGIEALPGRAIGVAAE
jgi:hypothetical protein